MSSGKSIQIGRRYRAADARVQPSGTWEVLELFRSRIDNLVYARLALVGDASRIKSLSTIALEDTRRFRPEPG
jgi:hypothetical protein